MTIEFNSGPTVDIIENNAIITVASPGPQGPPGPAGPSGPGTAIKQYNCFISTPTNITIPLLSFAEYPFTVIGVNNLKTATSTLILSFAIDDIPIAGLDTLTVSTVAQNQPATGANIVVQGSRLTMSISGSSATNLEFTLKGTL